MAIRPLRRRRQRVLRKVHALEVRLHAALEALHLPRTLAELILPAVQPLRLVGHAQRGGLARRQRHVRLHRLAVIAQRQRRRVPVHRQIVIHRLRRRQLEVERACHRLRLIVAECVLRLERRPIRAEPQQALLPMIQIQLHTRVRPFQRQCAALLCSIPLPPAPQDSASADPPAHRPRRCGFNTSGEDSWRESPRGRVRANRWQPVFERHAPVC